MAQQMVPQNPPLDRSANSAFDPCGAYYQIDWQPKYGCFLGEMGQAPVCSYAFYGNFRGLFISAALYY